MRPGASLLAELRAMAPLAAGHRLALAGAMLLGFGSALAESLGVSLVVLFLTLVLGGGASVAGGLLGRLYETAAGIAGGNGVALGAIIFALILGKALLALAYGLLITRTRNRISQDIRDRLHAQYLAMPYAELRRREAGDLLNILATESWSVAEAWHAAARILVNLCAIAVFGALLLAVSWPITLMSAVGAGLLSLVIRALHGRARRLGEDAIAANRALGGRMLAALQGLRTIRAFGAEPQEHARFRAASAEVRRRFDRLERLYTLAGPLGEVGSLAILGGIVVLALHMGLSAASTLAAVALLHRLNPHIREMEGHVLKLAGSMASVHAVRDVLERPGPVLPDGTLGFAGLREAIRFEDVSLTHLGASAPSLHAASFDVPRGQVTAIVGASGAGKTTVVNLLLRLYEPDAGGILVDGTPLAQLRRAEWLGHLALAGQDTELFEGTIAENIRMGRPAATLDEMRNAAAAAGILTMIEALPQRFESPVGERGLSLSGGQRQRIGLARALVRRPSLLILDEATNALDLRLEDDIRARLMALRPRPTVVLITHRLESALTADHVVCLEDGRVVEEGTPAQLRARETGAFREMLERRPV